MSGGAGGASGAARSSSPAAAAPRCCDTGRPIFHDPITGQTVCSCQYEFLNYQRLASGVPLSMYSAPYSDAAAATAAGMAAYFPALAADQPPFYPNAVSITAIIVNNTICRANMIKREISVRDSSIARFMSLSL